MSHESNEAARFAIDDAAVSATINETGGWCEVTIATQGQSEPIVTVTDLEGGQLRMGVPEAWEVITKLMHAMSSTGADLALLEAYRGECTVKFDG